MVYAKKKRSPVRRRRTRRYRRRSRKIFNRTKVKINDGNAVFMTKAPRGPLPMKYCATLPYVVTDDSLNPAAGTVATRVFRLNSCYDPDAAIGGHQPLGFDEMSKFYHNYTVIGCKATISFSNTDGTDAQYVGAFIHQSASPTIIPSTAMEQGLGSYTTLSARIAGHDTATGTITVKWSAKKWFGTKAILGDPGYTALTTADPTTPAYLVIWAAGRGAVDTDPVQLDVRLEYITVFTNPQYLNES